MSEKRNTTGVSTMGIENTVTRIGIKLELDVNTSLMSAFARHSVSINLKSG